MIDTEPLDVNETDTDLARCRVTTADALGQTRVYEIGLPATGMVGDEHVMAGRRVDDDRPDGMSGRSPSDAAWNAAREYFEGQGHEVFGDGR